MYKQVIGLALLCVLFFSVEATRPFTRGNLLALKQLSSSDTLCAEGSLVEFTSTGQVVQEVNLTRQVPGGCKVFTDDYYGRLTLSTDGSRAILPCCHPDPSDATKVMVSFAIISANGDMERTCVKQNSAGVGQAVNAALKGNDIWYSKDSHVWYTTIFAPTSTNIFEQDFFQLQIRDGKLYVGNYDQLPHTIVQVGSRLPKQFVAGNGTSYLDTNPTLSVNAFEFLDKYLVVNMYPSGINIYNLTSQALLYSVTDTEEIGQLVSLLDQGKIIAHVHSIGTTPASIYSFPFSYTTGIGSLSSATVLLTSTTHKYYSPIHVPQARY